MSLSPSHGKSKAIRDAGFNSSIPLSLNFAYTKAYVYATSPTISDKVLHDERGNRYADIGSCFCLQTDILVSDVLPFPYSYAVGFALRQTLYSPLRYVYHVVVKTGDNVSWKITNNDALSATVYYLK